jgi:hypothetical protein
MSSSGGLYMGSAAKDETNVRKMKRIDSCIEDAWVKKSVFWRTISRPAGRRTVKR